MPLPLILSVPHGGHRVPPELRALCRLSPDQIRADGDEFSTEIYGPLQGEVSGFIQADIARAVIDLNRAEDDIRKDGVVKTHTCWDVPVWRKPLNDKQIAALLARHHRPYHHGLRQLAKSRIARLGVDCHTMVAFGPPVGPDPGIERPQVCLGGLAGKACPTEWLETLKDCFQAHFPGEVTIDQPFAGGHITQQMSQLMPWVQLELSRGDFASPTQKAIWVRESLAAFCGLVFGRVAA